MQIPEIQARTGLGRRLLGDPPVTLFVAAYVYELPGVSNHPRNRRTALFWTQSSKMKVTSIVTRYSSIFPFFTLAFSSIT